MEQQYDALTKEIDTMHKQFRKLKKESKQIDASLEKLKSEVTEEEDKFRKEINLKKANQLQEAKDNATSDLNAKLARVETEIVSVEAKHKSTLKGLNRDEVVKNFRQERELYSDVVDSLAATRNQLIECIGERMLSVLESQLKTQKLELNESNMEDFVTYFNHSSEKLSKMNNGIVTKTIGRIQGMGEAIGSKRIAENQLNKVIIIVLCIIAGYFLTYFVYPVLILGLAFIASYNLYKMYRLYEAMLLYKAASDNISEVEKHLEEQINDEIDSLVEEENVAFDKKMNKLQEIKTNVKVEIDKALAEAERSFTFDEVSLQDNHKTLMQGKKDQVSELQARSTDLHNKINQLTVELENKNKQMLKNADDLPKKLLSPEIIGKSKIFNMNFLVEVDKSKPVYFEHPRKTVLFLYKELEEMNNFIKLMVYQLRAGMDPASFSVKLFDKKHLGNSMQCFVDKDAKNVFSIFSSEQTISEEINLERSTLQARVSNIKSSFKNIDEYNKAMMASESVTETYEFLFCVDALPLVSNEIFQPIIYGGADVGYYTHLFINQDEFFEADKTAVDVLNKVSNVYVFNCGHVISRSKEFLLEQLSKKKSR